MSIALIPLLPNQVLDKIFDYHPPNDCILRSIMKKHLCALEPDEYIYILPYGAAIYELQQMLLYDEFMKFGWDSDELIITEHSAHCVILEDDYELNDDYMLGLQLSEIRWSDGSESDSDDDHESDDE